MTRQPKAYLLALQGSAGLRHRYDALCQRLSGDGVRVRIRTFDELICSGRAAINATLSGCVRFLEHGSWLNVYESIALDPKTASGAAFRKAVREKLGEWYKPRVTFERLLKLSQLSHYASLNIGGGGPDYGPCCIRLGRALDLGLATTFAGDPLRVVFASDGTRQMADRRVLDRFAVFGDRGPLAAVHNESALTTTLALDEEAVIALLENRETLIEVHVHGPVLVADVEEITMRTSMAVSLEKRCLDYKTASRRERKGKRFDDVRAFKRLLKLIDGTDILFKRVRG